MLYKLSGMTSKKVDLNYYTTTDYREAFIKLKQAKNLSFS